jgi:hypothetical protein
VGSFSHQDAIEQLSGKGYDKLSVTLNTRNWTDSWKDISLNSSSGLSMFPVPEFQLELTHKATISRCWVHCPCFQS